MSAAALRERGESGFAAGLISAAGHSELPADGAAIGAAAADEIAIESPGEKAEREDAEDEGGQGLEAECEVEGFHAPDSGMDENL